MNKLLFALSILAILAFSSCKKGCVRCQAFDKNGTLSYQTSDVCGEKMNLTSYKKRFETNFADYSPKCFDVN